MAITKRQRELEAELKRRAEKNGTPPVGRLQELLPVMPEETKKAPLGRGRR